jgi:hypothetical protein
LQTGRWRLYANKESNFTKCDFKISAINVKNGNENDQEQEKETYDEDEKVELFRQFVQVYGREPNPDEKFNNFSIGRFYIKYKKSSIQYQILQNIMQEVIPK